MIFHGLDVSIMYRLEMFIERKRRSISGSQVITGIRRKQWEVLFREHHQFHVFDTYYHVSLSDVDVYICKQISFPTYIFYVNIMITHIVKGKKFLYQKKNFAMMTSGRAFFLTSQFGRNSEDSK